MATSSRTLARLLSAGSALQSTLAVKLDGWVNTLTGLGTVLDKGRAGIIQPDRLLSVQEMDWLYHYDDMANRICSAAPEDAMREGFSICNDSTDDEPQDLGGPEDETEDEAEDLYAAAIKSRMDELEVSRKVTEAMIWARAMGAGGIVLMVEGAGNPDEPLDEKRILRINQLLVVDRGDLQPATWYTDPGNLAKYGAVETYSIMVSSDQGVVVSSNVRVHETRVIMFHGVTTSRREIRANGGWRHSALQRVYNILNQSNGAWDGVIAMMQDMSQAVFRMTGLLEAIAEEGAEGEKRIQKRITLMNLVRSNIKALVLDAGTGGSDGQPAEDFKVVERATVTGSDALLSKVFLRLSAAARMPFSILMSQSPGGLGDTGATDLRWWYDIVRTVQTYEAKPRLNRLARIVAIELGINPEGWVADFPSLWQMTPTEEAEYRSKIAATDHIYVTDGVLIAEEICLSRWGQGVYSSEMNISQADIAQRRAILKAELANAEDLALNPPEPVPPTVPGAKPPNPAKPGNEG